MKRQVRLMLAALCVLAAAYLLGVPLHVQPDTRSAQQSGNVAADAWYPVVQVIDGDTIVVQKDGGDLHVRLLGIDTPEVQSKYRDAECYGTEASAAATQVMSGSDVRLVTDPSQDLYDQYGRLLAYVYVPANSRPEGILVNDYLLEGGFAREYTFKKPYELQSKFKAEEAAAREARRGLWGACASSSSPQ